ncbi:MAG: hypothetical protein QM820_47795 [Minicystis sp.]
MVIALALCGCDRFEERAAGEPVKPEQAEAEARAKAREAMAAVLKAAQAATASCVAGELHWEADPDGNAVPRHFSRPCIPERCATQPAEIEALRGRVRDAKAVVEGDARLRVPSYQGLVALGEAMVSFADTAMAGSASVKDKPARMSGLSMHYGALAAAYRELFAGVDVPLEPPSLVASLAVAEPGGDPCKGWAAPKYCDVRGVRVPKERRWRSDPPCIEVEGVRK